MTSRFPKISYNHDSKTGETRISEIEGFTNNINTTIKKDVKGCGCRFLNGKCEHLCYDHMTKFILEKYNADLLLNEMMEEDAKAMDDMNRQQ
jgi:hypothetical protein